MGGLPTLNFKHLNDILGVFFILQSLKYLNELLKSAYIKTDNIHYEVNNSTPDIGLVYDNRLSRREAHGENFLQLSYPLA